MNEGEWNDLKDLWQSGPTAPVIVTEELERLRKRRRWVKVEIVVSSVIALAGIAVGAALIANGGAFLIASGIATCMFVVAVCWIAAWGLRTPNAPPEKAVSHAVAIARQNARAGVRYAASMIWAGVVGLVFASFMCLARAVLATEAAITGFAAVGGVLLMLAAWLAFAFHHYRARSAALARLDAIAAELEQ